MKVGISGNLLKYALKNCYFITGTAYAGKSTMVHLLAEKYGGIECGENYHNIIYDAVNAQNQPNLSYFSIMKDWEEYVSRTPKEYSDWIYGCSDEAAELEIIRLLQLSTEDRKIFVDTNIPLAMLHEIATENHTAVMLSPQSMSVERFFDRDDEDKKFILQKIKETKNPEKTLENFKACVAEVNSKAHYDEYANGGFFTFVRDGTKTKEETLEIIAKAFGLEDSE